METGGLIWYSYWNHPLVSQEIVLNLPPLEPRQMYVICNRQFCTSEQSIVTSAYKFHFYHKVLVFMIKCYSLVWNYMLPQNTFKETGSYHNVWWRLLWTQTRYPTLCYATVWYSRFAREVLGEGWGCSSHRSMIAPRQKITNFSRR